MTKIGSRVIFPSWGLAGREFVHYGLGLYELLVPMEHPYKSSPMWFSQAQSGRRTR